MRHIVYILFLASFLFLHGCQSLAVEPDAVEKFASVDLKQQIDEYLSVEPVNPPERGRLLALIVPESDSPEAQRIMGKAFKSLQGQQFDTVIIVSQAHELAFVGTLVYSKGSFGTLFEPIEVDVELASHLISPNDGIIFNPHVDIESYANITHLSFIKRVLGDCKVVPILIGQPGQRTFDRLVAVLATEATKRKKRVLLVAVSDLSRSDSQDIVKEKDARTIDSLKQLKAGQTLKQLRSGEAALTGGNTVVVVMEATRRAGADAAEFFATGMSGNVVKQGQHVSGLASLGYYDIPLSDAERVELLSLAWRSVDAAVEGRDYEPEGELSPRLLAPGAAFITLEKNGALRGGIGQIQATGPLYRSVITSARAAAMEDNRFPPMSKEELNELSYEVSVLTPLVPVLDPMLDIELGTHGLYLNLEGHGGMLLPQVPVEQGWDLDEYLRQISLRAGLAPDAWEQKGARMWTFTTEIVR